MNAVAHCYSCHNYLGENPVYFADWAREHLGNYAMDMLIEKHHRIIKLTKKDKVEMYKFMKIEYQKLQMVRAYSDELLTFAGYL